MITWDEAKRQANIVKHGLDFIDYEAVFDHPVVSMEDTRDTYNEQRINLLGWLTGRVVHMTYTERGETLRVISLRAANRHETRHYFRTLSH